jgi:hypothetical protein
MMRRRNDDGSGVVIPEWVETPDWDPNCPKKVFYNFYCHYYLEFLDDDDEEYTDEENAERTDAQCAAAYDAYRDFWKQHIRLTEGGQAYHCDEKTNDILFMSFLKSGQAYHLFDAHFLGFYTDTKMFIEANLVWNKNGAVFRNRAMKGVDAEPYTYHREEPVETLSSTHTPPTTFWSKFKLMIVRHFTLLISPLILVLFVALTANFTLVRFGDKEELRLVIGW